MKGSNNSLYWRISITLLLLLIVLGVGYIFISSYIANQYYQESIQRLHSGLAESATTEVKPYTENGEIDKASIMDYMHSAMVMNPSAELYLLDTEGGIVTHAAPTKETVKLKKVDLKPIKTFIEAKEKPFIIRGFNNKKRENKFKRILQKIYTYFRN